MTINNNSVEQINVALLDMDKKLKSTASKSVSASDFKNLEASVGNIRKTLNETKAGLESGKTYNINISGNAATATKAKEAEKAGKLVNALTVNGETYDGSEAVDAGVQKIENGGTGATTAKEAEYNITAGMTEEDSDFEDTSFISGVYKSPSTTQGRFYRKTALHLWNYIKGKISSVLGLTKDNYGGKASTAETADKVANALTVNGKTYDGSSAVDAGIQKIENGGTGATTAKEAEYNIVVPTQNATLDAEPIDDEARWTGTYVSPSKTTGRLYTKKFSVVWNYIKDKISSVLGLTKDNYGGKASTAETADSAKNMYSQTLDLSELDKTKFYPVFCVSSQDFTEFAVFSNGGTGSAEYNQNRIHFDISTLGWSDEPFTLNIREYTCFDNKEITIGCIGRGLKDGGWAIWLRGGIKYHCFARNCSLSLKTSDYTYGNETYTVGTNYYGGANVNVRNEFTPQSTIKDGAYSNRLITAPTIKATTNFIGNLTGNVTGNVSGSSGSCTGISAKSSFLDEYPGAGSTRLTSLNIVPKDASEYGGMRKDVVTDSVTDGSRPGLDGHLLTMFWDNSGRYDSQLFISNDGNKPGVKVRYKSNKTDYGAWTDIITSNNIGSQTVAKAGTADTAGTADKATRLSPFASWQQQYVYDQTNGVRVNVYKITMLSYFNSILVQIYDDINYARCRRYILGLWHVSNYGYNVSVTDLGGTKVNGLKVWMGTDGNVYLQADVYWTSRITFSYLDDPTNVTITKIGNAKYGSNKDIDGNVLFTPLTDPITDCGALRGAPDLSSALKTTQTLKADVFVGNLKGNVTGNVTGNKLTIQGSTVNSNSYTDTNPKLEFKNVDGSQNISLTFTDYDSVQAPASLTLNGNQGNEYFIAPNIKATTNFIGNLTGKADTAGTASKVANKLTINGQSFDGSSAVDINIYGAYDHIVYDDASLLEWANCTDGSMKKVLIISGTYNMTKGVNLSNAGTVYVLAERGAMIISHVPVAFTDKAATEAAVIYNLHVECDGESSSENSCAFSSINGLTLYNCSARYTIYTATVNRSLFEHCTCYNCSYVFRNFSDSSSSISMKVFYQCKCYNCECLQTISTKPNLAISFNSESYFYKECHCVSCDAKLTTLRNIKAATPFFACYYNCYDRCVGCLSKINVNSKDLTVYSTLYGFFRCQYMSSCKETHTEGYANIKGIVQCDYISSTTGINGASNTHVGNSCSIA